MGTFHQWLHEQESRDDATGEIARWWAGDAADRPRASTPSGIQRWLDKELREGKLSGLDQESRGRMRIEFSDAVNEYHDRDRPQAVAVAGLPEGSGQQPPWIAEFREALRMLRVRTDQIAAAMGIDAPLAAQPGQLTPPASPDGTGLTRGHVEALKVRARLGDQAARELLAQHGIGVGETAAEPAADGAEQAQDGLAGPGAGDPAQAVAAAISAPPVLDQLSIAQGALHSDLPHDRAAAWGWLHGQADHTGAASIEGMPDNYAA